MHPVIAPASDKSNVLIQKNFDQDSSSDDGSMVVMEAHTYL
jgi:hypothetical protein